MFAVAELGLNVSKDEYKRREPKLRQELLEVQQELRRARRFPVIILFSGVDGAGKGETVNLLNEWMDSRWIQTFAYEQPSDEEAERPEFWRYWRDLPPKGQIGLFLSAWYSQPTLDWAYDRITESELNRRLDRIVSFGEALATDGALILKFWMHLSQEEQEKRFQALEKDPLLKWRVTERDWQHWKMYDRFIDAAKRVISRTTMGNAPWTIIEGTDANYRSLTVGEIIRDAIRDRLQQLAVQDQLSSAMEREGTANAKLADDQGITGKPENGGKKSKKGGKKAKKSEKKSEKDQPEPLTVLSSLDMSLALDRDPYKEHLKRYEAQLNLLHRRAKAQGISTVIVFEGHDAAGKGGAIRRLTATMDARNYRVLPFAAPSDEERAHHYLWRFWRHMSRAGRVTIFDRSWYGRVLVERVEGFATKNEWARAYAEINHFEAELIEHGIVLLKFWVSIDKEEQLRRFLAREQTPHKSWKLTQEDWRNRDKWNDYALAVHDMVAYTDTHVAPWVLVEGNDKRFARIRVLRATCERLEMTLGKD